ncbi:acyltransferase [Cytobacillus kochii]|uniref:acyltransferase n=1 Tax=Cytobacillus kochii TaxID=859143 RepID=UPI001CD792AB|nr:acyltransferase [Cytobacillus kochii]MCA1026902.1 acyltransferase [Cytobacillus kochii]MCM3322675.1 acyltransferase [Cytobacillus kochii]MCM3344846.1 acyltransferase [Cytobacillus kochii]
MILQEEIKGLTTKVFGKNNQLIYDEESFIFKNAELKITGSNNKIHIGKGTKLSNILIHIRGSNNEIMIGENTDLIGHILLKGKKQSIKVGDRTTFKNVYLLSQEGKNITIGADCMFSYDIAVRTTDAHSVLDLETNERLNGAKDVVIGNHVWVAASCLISKGAVIPDDTIIGARSVVTKPFSEAHTTIAGSPAKIIKTGTTWSRERL